MPKTNRLPSYIKLNQKIRPQDDFYAYVCHHWCQSNPLPSTRSRWGLFNALNEKVDKQIHSILNGWLKTETKDLTPIQRQVVIYYQALINKNKNQSQSQQTLQEAVQKLANCKSTTDPKSRLLIEASDLGLNAFFSLHIDLDSKNNQRYCLIIDTADLDLPDRDYYLSKNRKMELFRRAYIRYIKDHSAEFNKIGFKLDLKPAKILEIETFLAKSSWSLHHARDLQKTYNLYKWSDFCREFDFDWQNYFKSLEIEPGQEIIVSQPDSLQKALKYLADLPVDELENYLTYKLTQEFGDLINEKITKIHFGFFGKTLSGIEKMKPLKRRAADSANRIFCDTFGQKYIEQHFTPKHKNKVEAIATHVSQAFNERLAKNTWMSAKSHQYAQSKLANIIVNVGYSDFWDEYTGLKLKIDNPLENKLSIIDMEKRKSLALLKQKPNRRRFNDLSNDVQVVNAWTNLVLLNTNYPAAFLQKPFYDHEAGLEYNLGSLGSTIGHELTHNFDDQGSRYDYKGHLKPWLSKEEQKAFKKATDKLVKRASKHYPTPKIHMKGKQVIGELIADLGGLEIVLDIVKKKYANTSEAKRKEALRKVFIAYSFHFAINESVEAKIMLTKSGVHPNSPFRVNGIIVHCDDFYEAFDVKERDNLYIKPAERVQIW